MTLAESRRASDYDLPNANAPINNNLHDYNPQHVRRSLLGERRWSYAVEHSSNSVIVRPGRKQSFTGFRSSCSASLIFDSPTLFPNSLAPSETTRLSSSAALPDFESHSNLTFPSRNSVVQTVERRMDVSRSKPDLLPAKPRAKTIRSFNARLNSFAQKGNYIEILSLIEDVQNGTINISGPLNTYSFTILLKAYCNAGQLIAARKLLETMHTFDKNKRPNRFTYNTLMNAFIRWEDIQGATDLFEFMETNANESIRPDHVTYTTLMKGYATSGDMKAATNLFQRLRDHPDPECRPNQVTYNTMLKGFVAEGDMDAADRLVEEMLRDSKCRPDIVSMNTIIGGYARQGNMQRANEYFERMRSYDIIPNAVTLHALIEGSVRIGDMEYAEHLFQSTINDRNPVTLSAATYRAIIEAWVRLGELEKAEFVFDHQVALCDPANQPNQTTCMLMAAAFSQAGLADKKAALFSGSRFRHSMSSLHDSSSAFFETSDHQLQISALRSMPKKRESVGSFSSDEFAFKLNFEQY